VSIALHQVWNEVSQEAEDKNVELLSKALKAICLTRDYVGEDTLPAIDGWEWYEAGKELAKYVQNEWSNEFYSRVNRYRSMKDAKRN